MPERLQDLYEFERELREVIAHGGADHIDYPIWLKIRRDVLSEIQAQRRDYSAKQPITFTQQRRAA